MGDRPCHRGCALKEFKLTHYPLALALALDAGDDPAFRRARLGRQARLGGGDATVSDGRATVRQHVEKIDGVTATWFELRVEAGVTVRTLVVEVAFDIDPGAGDFRKDVLDAIEGTARDALAYQTTLAVADLKIVPRRV